MSDSAFARPMPSFERQALWAVALLAVSVGYAAAIWAFAPYIAGKHLMEAVLYGVFVWLVAGALSFAVFTCVDGVPARAVRIFYMLWALAIPLIEIPLSVKAHDAHWVFLSDPSPDAPRSMVADGGTLPGGPTRAAAVTSAASRD